MKWNADYKSIIVRPGIITRIIHNEPEKRNPLTTAFMNEFPDALKQALLDPIVKVVVLTSNGSIFCSGHDLHGAQEIVGRDEEPDKPFVMDDWRRYLTYLKHVYYMPVWNFEKPLICGVQGMVAAGGITLVAMCDISIVTADCKFNCNIMHGGGADPMLAFTWSGNYRKAMEIYLTAKSFNAEEAKEMGLITCVVPPDKLEEETMRYAKTVSLIPPESQRANKMAIKSLYMDLTTRALQLGCDADVFAHSSAQGSEKEFMRIVRERGIKEAIAWMNAPFEKIGVPGSYEARSDKKGKKS